MKRARACLFVASLVAVTAGFWLAWQPLGLIVPGAVVMTGLIYSHVRGEVIEKKPEARQDA